jgi:hypothetical protein
VNWEDPVLHGGGATMRAASCFPVKASGLSTLLSVEPVVWVADSIKASVVS